MTEDDRKTLKALLRYLEDGKGSKFEIAALKRVLGEWDYLAPDEVFVAFNFTDIDKPQLLACRHTEWAAEAKPESDAVIRYVKAPKS